MEWILYILKLKIKFQVRNFEVFSFWMKFEEEHFKDKTVKKK